MIAKWQPALVAPWTLESQARAAGLEIPTVTADAWTFLAARVRAHLCARADCQNCREARRLGWTAVRITAAEVANGVALDKVAGALWAAARQKGLF